MSTLKQALSVDLKLPATSAFVEDPKLAAEMQTLYNAVNRLAYFVDSATGRTPLQYEQYEVQTIYSTIRSQLSDVIYAKATVTIPAGAACYVRPVGDIYEASLAIATTSGSPPDTFATCFCTTDGGITAGDFGVFSFGGLVPYIAGLNQGEVYYLSDITAGQLVATPPVAGGTFVQSMGFALAPTVLYAKIQLPAL